MADASRDNNRVTTLVAVSSSDGTTIVPLYANPTTHRLIVDLSSGANFAENETPTGTINGSNVTFTLANTPTSGSVQLFLNGARQESGATRDYTISGLTITFVSAPLTNSRMLADYRY